MLRDTRARLPYREGRDPTLIAAVSRLDRQADAGKPTGLSAMYDRRRALQVERIKAMLNGLPAGDLRDILDYLLQKG
jgi:hypothetical protein